MNDVLRITQISHLRNSQNSYEWPTHTISPNSLKKSRNKRVGLVVNLRAGGAVQVNNTPLGVLPQSSTRPAALFSRFSCDDRRGKGKLSFITPELNTLTSSCTGEDEVIGIANDHLATPHSYIFSLIESRTLQARPWFYYSPDALYGLPLARGHVQIKPRSGGAFCGYGSYSLTKWHWRQRALRVRDRFGRQVLDHVSWVQAPWPHQSWHRRIHSLLVFQMRVNTQQEHSRSYTALERERCCDEDSRASFTMKTEISPKVC